MRKNRFIGQDRCYHLISRLAHRAFFLDGEEKDRAVAMSEVLKAREAERGDCHAGRGAASFRSKADPQLDIPEKSESGLRAEAKRLPRGYLNSLPTGPCVRRRAGGGRHQEPRPFLALLHDAAGGEGACRKNRSRQTDVAKAGIQAGMRCCINKTISISSDPLLSLRFHVLSHSQKGNGIVKQGLNLRQ